MVKFLKFFLILWRQRSPVQTVYYFFATLGVFFSAGILLFVGMTYYAQRKFQEASVFPSIIMDMQNICDRPKYECFFEEDTTGLISYIYILQNKSNYTVREVRPQSTIGFEPNNPLSYESMSDSGQIFVLAPSEMIRTTGKVKATERNWKRKGKAYLYIRVDFKDPNGREFAFKKTLFLQFEGYEVDKPEADWIFKLGLVSSTLDMLRNNKGLH